MSLVSTVLKEQVLDPEFASHPPSAYGKIIEFQYPSMTATVEFYLPQAEEPVVLSNVPVSRQVSGISEPAIPPGTECVVGFRNGSQASPYVSTITSSTFDRDIRRNMDCSLSGGTLPQQQSDWEERPIAERPVDTAAPAFNPF